MRLLRILSVLAFTVPTVLSAEIHWQKLEGCKLIPDEWHDGDSFHVSYHKKEYIFRLYFVDTPEDETRFPERIAEQATYFGITSKRALEIGKIAAYFTAQILGSSSFTIWTCWQDALGTSKQPRFYAIIETSKGSLVELLVSNGLARIYGKRITLPDGTSSQAYRAKLQELQKKAKQKKKGAWSDQPLL